MRTAHSGAGGIDGHVAPQVARGEAVPQIEPGGHPDPQAEPGRQPASARTLPPGLTLLLESSTSLGSVAIFNGSQLLVEVRAELRDRNSERLMPAVTEAFQLAGTTPNALARVACGSGPGSFTGLRIGASIAKGIAHAAGLPLHSVSSLCLTGGNAVQRHGDGLYMAVRDAMRGECFAMMVQGTEGLASAADTVELHPADALPALAEARGAVLVGPQYGDVWPTAAALAACDGAALVGPLDLASWEPEYGRVAEAQAKWEAARGRPLEGA